MDLHLARKRESQRGLESEEKIPPTRHGGGVIASDLFGDENEQLSDHRIRFGENVETRSARQRFPQGGRTRK
jgi:hypothetical protein